MIPASRAMATAIQSAALMPFFVPCLLAGQTADAQVLMPIRYDRATISRNAS